MTYLSKLNETQKTWLGFVLVGLGLFVLNYNLLDRLDIISDDDDLYFMFGMDYLKGKYRGPDDGALYCLWQLAIQLMTNDAAQTFYVNWILMTILPTIGFYAVMRSMKVNMWVSVWVALCYTFSLMNFPLTPKLTHFTIAILLGGMIVVRRVDDLQKKLFWGAVTIFVASYVRPEMYVGLWVMLAWLAWISYTRKNYRLLLIMLAITVVSGLLVGTPIRENDRSFWTFKHHFSINYVSWYPEIGLSPWNHFNEITTQVFGHKLTSPMDAFLTDPALVMRHFFFNVGNLAKETFTYLHEMFVVQLSQMFRFPHRGLVLVAVFLIVLALIDYKRSWKTIRTALKENAVLGAILFVFLIPSLLSTTIIYPRPHYILYHFLLYVPLIGLLVSSIKFRKIGSLTQNFTLGIAVLNLLFISIFLYPKVREASKDLPTPNRAFALMLQGLDIKQDVRLLGGDAPFTYPRYVSPNWKDFFYFDIHRPENFARFVQEKDINCIIINKKMNDYFAGDSTYQAFRQSPESLDFIKIKQTSEHLIYKKEHLQ
ncbi:hypothetical protein [Arundinibacter roseus]|uniref:Glycosyltransferase RgtA/B/C/D-like domain-containing protein n=1 Tax=Arundinibacter roseus TaxID=2070510 RepID=A0A4R4K803_9BACT|nr:hypothetical protein [Arundinibacter roseus]TDB63804.1 hypothetical protein EZE20_16060 [Arundinibacter roseus]